jgi:hypothetical protein
MSPMAYEIAELGTSPLSQDHPQARDSQRSLPRLRGALAVPAAVYGHAALPGAHQRRLVSRSLDRPANSATLNRLDARGPSRGHYRAAKFVGRFGPLAVINQWKGAQAAQND